MTETLKPQCILGNGDCPPDCSLHDLATKIMLQRDPDVQPPSPFMSRLAVVFGDALNPDCTVVDVARAMGACLNEASLSDTDQLPQ